MDRSTALWALVAFFGASVAFNLVIRATEGASGAARFGLQVVVLACIVGVIVVLVRRSDRR